MLGLKIKEYLKSNGISQIFLSNKTGIDKNKLNQILNDKCSLSAEHYIKICNALNVSCDYFSEEV